MEEKDKKTRQTFRDFIEAINSRDLDKLCSMMISYHEFIDSLGNSVKGMDNLRKAWAGYFKMVPDYRIELRKILVDDSHILATGTASGTFSPDGSLSPADRWKIPAAWESKSNGDQLEFFCVFADNEPIRAVMRKYSKAGS